MKFSLLWTFAFIANLLILVIPIIAASATKELLQNLSNETDASDIDIGSRSIFQALRFCRPGQIRDHLDNCRDVVTFQ